MTDSAATMTDEKPARVRDSFAHVDTWVFDLDDTLYPRSVDLHGQMRERVVTFIADHMKIDRATAQAVHVDYYERFGSTLQGMVQLHGILPNGGMVSNVWIEGDVYCIPGDIDPSGLAMITVPVKILIP